MLPSRSRFLAKAQLTFHTTKTENRSSVFPIISLQQMFTISKIISLCTFCPPGRQTRTFVVTACCPNHQAIVMRQAWLSYNNIYLILNSWSITLLTPHLPETMQHSFYHSIPYLPLRTGPTPERTKTTLTTRE